MRTGEGIAGLSSEPKTVGLLLCYDDHGWTIENELPALREALEAAVFSTQEARKHSREHGSSQSLAVGSSHVQGLHMLAHDPQWQSAGGALAAGWLMDFPDVPLTVESELADCPTHSGSLLAERLAKTQPYRTSRTARPTAAKNAQATYHASGMPLSRHEATSRAGIGEICGLRYDVAAFRADARCLLNVLSTEPSITLYQVHG